MFTARISFTWIHLNKLCLGHKLVRNNINLTLFTFQRQSRIALPNTSNFSGLKVRKFTNLIRPINLSENYSLVRTKLSGSFYSNDICQTNRLFHTSGRRYIPPIILLLIKPVAKVGAALTGRSIRVWFRRLGPNERKEFIASLKKRWHIFAGLFASIVGGLALFYWSHLQLTPITGRKRFILLKPEQIEKISDAEAKKYEEDLKEKFYSTSDPRYQRVVQVAMKIIEANAELQPMEKWRINVVSDPLVNAFVLPNNCIFVFDGILQMANTQDQLAVILGHEMAHNVLGHANEELSYGRMLDFFIIACIATLWLIIPIDSVAFISQLFYEKVNNMLTRLPHSRDMEKEADKVGLKFAAKACFDVRDGSVLWQKMSYHQKLQEDNIESQLPEWIQTHPDSMKRAKHLDFLFPQAEEWRKEMKCPSFPEKDPRECFQAVSKEFENLMLAAKAGQNLRAVPQKVQIWSK